MLFILFPPHARFAKSRVLRVCASRVIAADKISPSFFLSFTFSLLVLRREEAGKTREREREGTNPSVGFVVFASETRTERSLFLSLSLHLNSPHPLSLSLFFQLLMIITSLLLVTTTAKNVRVRNRNVGNVREGQTEARRFVRSSNGDDGPRDGVRNRWGGFSAQSGVFRALGVGETGVSSRVFKRRVEGFEVRGIFFVENFVGSGD